MPYNEDYDDEDFKAWEEAQSKPYEPNYYKRRYPLPDENSPDYKGKWLGDVNDYDLLMVWLAKKNGGITFEEAKNVMPFETDATIAEILDHYGTRVTSVTHEDRVKYGAWNPKIYGEPQPFATSAGARRLLSIGSPWNETNIRKYAPSHTEKWYLRTGNPPTKSWTRQTWKYNK
jgi:hypothetical protein